MNTSVLVLSRPATILKPVRVSQLCSQLHTLTRRKQTVIIVARGLKRIRRRTSHIAIVQNNQAILRTNKSAAHNRLLSTVFNSRISITGRRSRLTRAIIRRSVNPAILRIHSLSIGNRSKHRHISSLDFRIQTNRILYVLKIRNGKRTRLVSTLTKLHSTRNTIVITNRSIDKSKPHSQFRRNIQFISRSHRH